jgi:hypothetical protein
VKPVRVTGYAYPWDVLDDPGFAARAAEIGVAEVAVAVSYHATRAATPWQTRRSAVVAPHSAFHRPVRGEAWPGDLRPEPAPWTGRPDSAGDAVAAVRAAGLTPVPWVVLAHNSLLGNRFPDETVVNCFGERYPWAPCPARERVRDYAATLAAEALRGLDTASVILESCGQMSAVHQHTHEKSDAVWSPAAARLLSVCCCGDCAARWRAHGLDPAEVTGLLRERVLALVASGDLAATADGLPADVAAALLAGRQASTDLLRGRVLAAIDGLADRIVLHASPDPWATGALPGLTPATGKDVHAVVVPCWARDAGVGLVERARAELPDSVAVGAYVTVAAAAPLADPAGYVRDLAAAGAGELHLYHLGLAGPARSADARAAAGA